jgi:hypothetical protein
MKTASAEKHSPTKPTGVRKLRDTDLASVDHMQDVRGQEVVDSAGTPVGIIDALYIDEGECKVRLLRIRAGQPLGGTAERKYLVPVDAIAHIRGGIVKLDRPGRLLALAPRNDTDLSDRRNLEFLLAHYGGTPFWERQYLYPPFPHYL